MTTDLSRQANKQPVLLADWQVPYEVSRHRFPNGSKNNNGLVWFRNFVIGSTTYNQAEYVDINPYIAGVRRDVVRLTVGGHEYTAANSVHACDSTFGSWYFDPIKCRLYVNPAINKPFDKVFSLDGGDYVDLTDAARTATTADITILGGNGKKHYLGMFKSRHRLWRFTFSTAPVGGTRDWKYWDGDGLAFSSAIDGDLVAVTGNINLTATDNIIRWTTPQDDWDLYDGVGDVDTVGTPECFWIEVTNASGYSTAGVGSQFFVAPVLEESVVVAFLEVPVGSKPVHVDGKYYMPRLILSDNNTKVELTSKNSNKFQEAMIGTAVTGNNGDLIINNADGLFDDFFGEDIQRLSIYEPETTSMPHGGLVPLRIGYDTPSYTMPIDDYLDIRSPMIEGVSWKDRTIELMLMNQTMKMDVPIMQKLLTVAEYPRIEPDKEGVAAPLFFGDTEIFAPPDGTKDTPKTKTARALRGEMVDPGKVRGNGNRNASVLFGAQIINHETGHAHGFGTVAEVRAIKNNNKKSAKIKAGKYELRESNCLVDFKKKYVLKGEAIMLTEGIVDDPSGTFTGTPNALITKPWDIVHFILVCICKYKTSDLELATFTEVGVTKQGVAGTLSIPDEINDECSVYIFEEKETARDVINRLMFQIDAVCQPNNEGKLQISVRSEDITNTDPVLFRHQTSAYEVVWDTEYMGHVIIRYRQIPPTDERSVTDPAQVENFPNSLGFPEYIADNFSESYLGLSNPIEFDTYMITEDKATALRDRLQKRFRRGRKLYKVLDVYGVNMSRLLGENVLLKRSRSLGGELKEEQAWLLSCVRDHGKHSVYLEAIEAKVV